MKSLLVTIFILLMNGCSDKDIVAPSDIPIKELLSAPDTIMVENRQMTLSTYMWRDFMPGENAGGSALIAIAYITAIDTAKLQIPITVDAIWVVYLDKAWHSPFSNEETPDPERRVNRIVKVAREGPKWGPNVFVDVIVRVIDSKGVIRLLRASKQYIGMTV